MRESGLRWRPHVDAARVRHSTMINSAVPDLAVLMGLLQTLQFLVTSRVAGADAYRPMHAIIPPPLIGSGEMDAPDPAIDAVALDAVSTSTHHVVPEGCQHDRPLPEALGVARRREDAGAIRMRHQWLGALTETLHVPRETLITEPNPRFAGVVRRLIEFGEHDLTRRERFTQLSFAATQSVLTIRIFLQLATKRGGEMRKSDRVIRVVCACPDFAVESGRDVVKCVGRARGESTPRVDAECEFSLTHRPSRVEERAKFFGLHRTEVAIGRHDADARSVLDRAPAQCRQHLRELQLVVQIGFEPEHHLVGSGRTGEPRVA